MKTRASEEQIKEDQKFQSSLLQTLKQRGFLYQCTDALGLDQLLINAEKSGKKVSFYLGFDLTATSLHVGSMMQLMLALNIIKSGHKVIILLGEVTTQIGDPTGKDEIRKMLTNEQIRLNKDGISKTIKDFLIKNGADAESLLVVSNADWAGKGDVFGLSYIEFLSKFGRHFSINKMLAKDSVKTRLEREQNLTFLEFNYMLIQALDFAVLHSRYGAQVQVGGSDQWGNIITGVELISKLSNVEDCEIIRPKSGPAIGLTTPLLTTSSGAKMGKTEGGAVWLNKEMTTPFALFQYLRNIDDADILRIAKLLSFLELSELQTTPTSDEAMNTLKEKFAHHVTELVHNKEEADQALGRAKGTFGGEIDLSILPEVRVSTGVTLLDLVKSAVTSDPDCSYKDASNRELKTLIESGAVKIDDTAYKSAKTTIEEIASIMEKRTSGSKMSIGKKSYFCVKW